MSVVPRAAERGQPQLMGFGPEQGDRRSRSSQQNAENNPMHSRRLPPRRRGHSSPE